MDNLHKIELAGCEFVYIRLPPDFDPERPVGAFEQIPKLEHIGKTIRGIAQSVRDGLKGIKVNTVTLDFGLELGVEGGQLMSIFAKTSGKADLRVKIEIASGNET